VKWTQHFADDKMRVKKVLFMENILIERIKNARLTKSQKKIADWLVKNPDKIGNLSSLEAARAIGVSDASIIRFSRAIGFDGFADLKDHVYGMLVENAFSELSLPERVSQTNERYSEIDVFSEFQKLMNQNITLSFHNNKMEDFEKAAKMLAEANRKYVIGMRGCKGIAVEFGRLLTFMTEKVTAIIDGECTSISAMQDIGKEDVVIMFAFARYYKIDLKYLKMAKERGAQIILILNDITASLTDYADLVLTVSTENMSFFNSKIGAEVISEYILVLMSRKIDYMSRLVEREELTADERI